MPLWLKVIVYPIVGLLFLVVFSLLLFPFDSLKDRGIQELQHSLGDSYDIQIKSVSYRPFTTVLLKGVKIALKADEKQVVKFEKVKLHFSPAALFNKEVALDFDLKDEKSHVEGSFLNNAEVLKIDSNLEHFDLALVRFLLDRWKIPIEGMLSGTIALEWYWDNPLRNMGQMSLQLETLQLGAMKIPGAIDLPAMALASEGKGDSKIDLKINRANWTVEDLELHGADLDLTLNGKVYGAKQLDNYRFNLRGDFKLAPELIQKLPLLAMIDAQKTPEGIYPLTVTGRLSKPNIRIGEFKVPLF